MMNYIELYNKYSQELMDKPIGNLPMWESAYFGKNKALFSDRTYEVQTFYRKQGLGVKGEHPADHLGVECAFMAWCKSKMFYYKSTGDSKREEKFRIIQVAFLNEHLIPFLKEIHKVSDADQYFYELGEFLAKDLVLLEERSYQIEELSVRDFPIFYERNDGDGEPHEVIIHTSGRNNCGGRCIINAHVKDGCILKLSGDKRLPWCSRGMGYIETLLSPKRLLYPMKRVGERGEGKFKRISWEEATSYMAKEFTRIKNEYGPGARFVCPSSGISAVMDGERMIKRLFAVDGGFLDDRNDYSSACTTVATPFTYGTNVTGNSMSDLVNSKLIILWGHNPVETKFGTLTSQYIAKAKRAGAKIIAVDPRYNDTALRYADQWIGLKPSTDSALMDGMAYIILEEGLQDQKFMDTFCLGFDQEHMPEGMQGKESYYDYIYGISDGVPKTPEWASQITGVEEADIIQLAREYALAKPAALLQGYGPQRHGNGEQTARSSTMLACLTGNVGIHGGSASGRGKVKGTLNPKFPVPENAVKGTIPTFLWSEAIIRGSQMTDQKDGIEGAKGLDSNIKCIVTIGGNTLLNQHSDINQTSCILKDTSLCEFIVCSDLFLTPSAKYADLLLPGTSMFEGENITTPWTGGGYLLYNNKVIDPIYECRFEYDWIVEVAQKMGVKDEYTNGHHSVKEWLLDLYNETRLVEKELPDFEAFQKSGGYIYREKEPYVAFQKQREDLANNPFPTPSGKIEIFSKRLWEMNNPKEIPAIPKYVESFEGPRDKRIEKYPLQLIGWHSKRRCHSTCETNDSLERREPHCLWIHPLDAKERNLSEQDMVLVWNDRGSMKIKIHITDRIVKGVVAMPQGAWFTPDENGVDQRGSINVLTTLQPTPLAKGNPQHSNLVEIEGI